MGLFGSKARHPLAGLTAHDLKRGTQVPVVDVEPDFVAYAREARPRVPRLGHETPIALVLSGDDVVAYYDDQRVGRMDPAKTGLYRREFEALAGRRQFGRTVLYVKPEGSTTPHAVALNWGAGAAVDGGIL